MRSIVALITFLAVLAGCSHLQRPAGAQRAAIGAGSCDSSASIAAERAQLASVARMLADMSNGASANAYSTTEPRVAPPTPSAPASSATAAKATSSMIANANNARVELWAGEARQELTQYQGVVARIAALDAIARTLPTSKACGAAGLASFSAPAS